MLKKIELIGRVKGQSLRDLKQFCQEHYSLLKPTISTYATGRKELWIRRQCDLRKTPTILEGYRHQRLEDFGERLLPNFHIGLLLFYPPQTQIKLHRDHTVFEKIGVGVNIGKAKFLMAETPKKGEKKIQPISYFLNDGDCLKFNTKILHGIESVNKERWAIYFWHLKRQYL